LAFLGTTLNVADLPQSENNYDPIPAGNYTARITQAELTQTTSGGTMIKLRLDITGPSHQGRVLFSNINIRNANPEAERIGMQQLGDISRAIGLTQISDTDQMIGGNLQVKVAIRTSEQYGAQNDVKGYKAIEGGGMPSAFGGQPVAQPQYNAPPQQAAWQQPAAQQPVQAAPAGAAPPWAKR